MSLKRKEFFTEEGEEGEDGITKKKKICIRWLRPGSVKRKEATYEPIINNATTAKVDEIIKLVAADYNKKEKQNHIDDFYNPIIGSQQTIILNGNNHENIQLTKDQKTRHSLGSNTCFEQKYAREQTKNDSEKLFGKQIDKDQMQNEKESRKENWKDKEIEQQKEEKQEQEQQKEREREGKQKNEKANNKDKNKEEEERIYKDQLSVRILIALAEADPKIDFLLRDWNVERYKTVTKAISCAISATLPNLYIITNNAINQSKTIEANPISDVTSTADKVINVIDSPPSKSISQNMFFYTDIDDTLKEESEKEKEKKKEVKLDSVAHKVVLIDLPKKLPTNSSKSITGKIQSKITLNDCIVKMDGINEEKYKEDKEDKINEKYEEQKKRKEEDNEEKEEDGKEEEKEENEEENEEEENEENENEEKNLFKLGVNLELQPKSKMEEQSATLDNQQHHYTQSLCKTETSKNKNLIYRFISRIGAVLRR